MCHDWESNLQPFGSQASTWSTKPHQPGHPLALFIGCDELGLKKEIVRSIPVPQESMLELAQARKQEVVTPSAVAGPLQVTGKLPVPQSSLELSSPMFFEDIRYNTRHQFGSCLLSPDCFV